MFGYMLGRFTSPDPLSASAKSGIPQSLNRYAYVLNNPFALTDPTGMVWGYYDKDGSRHFRWFDGLGRNVVSQSVDNDQDDVFVATCYDNMGRVAKTSNPVRAASAPEAVFSIKAYKDRILYHFTTVEVRNSHWSIFQSRSESGDDGAYAGLGTFLHAKQDSFSHSGFEPLAGQGTALTDNFNILTSNWRTMNEEARKYDKTTDDPKKAFLMARDTLSKLLQARNLMEKSGKYGTFRDPVPFETDKFINEKLWEWANTEGRDAKRNILFEIMNYVARYNDPPAKEKPQKKRRKKKKDEMW